MTAFGPFAGSVSVDFDELSEHGLFLLHGPTGAGKTSLLDGICFALYGSVPGKRAESKRLRSDHAAPDAVCEVSLEATIAGQRIRVTRRPAQERPKKRGGGVITEPAFVALEQHGSTGWEPVSQRVGEADKEISELIGMSVDQFAQVIMLPQGRFAEFLQSGSDQRAKLLERLFSTERFRSAEAWLADRRRVSDNALSGHDIELGKDITRVEQCVGLVAPEDELVVEWANRIHEELSAELLHADATIVSATTAAEQAVVAWDLARKAFERSESHAKAMGELTALEADQPTMSALTLELRSATTIAPLLDLIDEAEGAVASMTSASAAAAAAAADAAGFGAVAGEDAKSLEQRRDSALKAATALESLRPVAVSYESAQTEAAASERQVAHLRSTLAVAERERDQIRSALSGALSTLSASTQLARAAALKARESAIAAKETEQQLRQLRLDGMSAELAASLGDDQPCPVCGSHEHPSLAVHAGIVVTAEQEELAAQEAAALATVAGEATTELEIGEATLARLSLELAELGIEASPRSESIHTPAHELLSALRELTATIATTTVQLKAELGALAVHTQRAAALQQQISEALGESEDLDQAIAVALSASAAFAAAAEALKADAVATASASACVDKLQRRLDHAGISDGATALAMVRDEQWCETARATLEAHTSALAIARSEISKLADTPVSMDLAAAEQAATASAETLRGLSEIRTKLHTRVEDLAKLLAPLAASVAARVPLAAEAELTRELANLAGGTGSNAFKMPLSTYVLVHRLEHVAVAASARLSRMTGGRYTLEHTDDHSGNAKAGLGLRVNDAHTGRARDTSSLSGGETFMASLALALGLAEVVSNESGGRPIEALFVDEGFGTLDEDTLDEVMNVLDSLREGGRLVGVVSHVAALHDRIPAQVHVRRSTSGSTVDVRVS